MITSLIGSVSQSLGYSLFCHTGFWGSQYRILGTSFTDIQTLSLSLLLWFSSVHSKKTFNATYQIMLLSMRWDTTYVATLPTISKIEMQSSDSLALVHAHIHINTQTRMHTTCSSPAMVVGTSGSVLFIWLWNLPSHSVECFCMWKLQSFSQFLGLR